MKLHQLALVVGVATTSVAMSPEAFEPIEPQGHTSGDVAVVEVAVNGGNETAVVLLVDDTGDGVANKFFRLQVLGAESETNAPTILRNASITWDQERVLAASASGGVLLSISDLAVAPRSDIEGIQGFGMSRSAEVSLRLDDPELVTEVQALFESCNGMECRAGGPGAESCEYSCSGQSCSVSCGDNEPCCGCGTSGPCCLCMPPS